jgi:hypothetical protein
MRCACGIGCFRGFTEWSFPCATGNRLSTPGDFVP